MKLTKLSNELHYSTDKIECMVRAIESETKFEFKFQYADESFLSELSIESWGVKAELNTFSINILIIFSICSNATFSKLFFHIHIFTFSHTYTVYCVHVCMLSSVLRVVILKFHIDCLSPMKVDGNVHTHTHTPSQPLSHSQF